MTDAEYLKLLQNLRVEQYETLAEIRDILDPEHKTTDSGSLFLVERV